ncbi:hypothetical protein C7212DRAFT_314749 [Tuber magnatum]|uniref:Uncharacterized protein n=1 Tax=Tuber magnatum TaxID=42249 RepID=A0A317ST93_9PEZI|nr:hypothetical protein C7212DRAFT_314749 [Tuber magnatum]
MDEPQANNLRTAEIITIVFTIITAVVSLLQLFPNCRFGESRQPIPHATPQELRPVLVVNCVGQLHFRNPEREVDLEQGSGLQQHREEIWME